MAIIRRSGSSHWFAVSRQLAQNESISLDAVGLMSYLLSKPDDWEAQLSDIERRGKFGKEKRLRILKELETEGYIQRIETRDERGKIDYDLIVYASPLAADERTSKTRRKLKAADPQAADPQAADPQAADPQAADPPTVHDRVQYTESQKTESQETEPHQTDQQEPPDGGSRGKPPKPPTFGKLKATEAERAQVVECFTCWTEEHKKPNAKLLVDSARWRATLERLRDGYTVEQIKLAIRGLKKSDWHMGRDPKTDGKRYDDLFNVCKSPEVIERFMDLEQEGAGLALAGQPQQTGKLFREDQFSAKTKGNAAALNTFIARGKQDGVTR